MLLLIIRKEEKEFVLNDRSADRASKLLPDIFRLDRNGPDRRRQRRRRISRAPLIITVEVKQLAVKIIGSTFGNRVNDTARGPAVFGRIVCVIYLKFADGCLAY